MAFESGGKNFLFLLLSLKHDLNPISFPGLESAFFPRVGGRRRRRLRISRSRSFLSNFDPFLSFC